MSVHIAKWALLIGAFALWTNRGVNVGFQQLSIVQGMSIIAFLATMHRITMFPRIVPHQTRELFLLLLAISGLMILAILASMLVAVHPIDGVRFMGRWVYGLFYLFAAMVLSRGGLGLIKKLIMAFLLGGALTALFCAAGYVVPAIGEIVFQDIWSKRAMGFMQHPNQLAMLYTGAIVLAFWPGLMTLPWRFVMIACLLMGVVLTGSKFNMGLVMLIVPLLIFWLPAREGRIAEASASLVFGIPLAGLTAVAAAYLLQANNESYYKRLVTFVDDPSGAETTTSRFDIWNKAFNCWQENPVVGIGAGNAQECIPFVHAHNVFINYLLETGLFGIFALVSFFGAILIIIRSVNARAKMLPNTRLGKNDSYRGASLLMVSVLSYILSNCSSDSMGPATMPTLWFYLALLLGLNSNVALMLGRNYR